MEKLTSIFCITLLLSTFSTLSYSQEDTKDNKVSDDEWQAYLDNLAPEKSEITDYSMMFFFDVEVGQEDTFKELVTKYFIEGSKLAGVAVPTLYTMTTGEYSFMVIYPTNNPGEEFEFSRTAEDVKFMKSLAQHYSKEEIKSGFDKFYSLIKRSKRIIIGKVAPY